MSLPEGRRRGPGRAGLLALGERLSERDRAVLDAVSTHRFLTTRHIEQLLFHDHASALAGARACRRTLARLEGWSLLQRLQRRVGGLRAGSAASIWAVSTVGQRLRSLHAGEGAIVRVREPSERFARHCLAIADLHVSLVLAERAGQLEVLETALEPDCWRSYLAFSGIREVLKPDLFAVTISPSDPDFEHHWFVERDLGHEHLPTVLAKCRQYQQYQRTGQEQQARGIFPLVVWVMSNELRVSRLQDNLTAARGLDAVLFRVTTPESFMTLVTGGTV